MAWPGRTIQCTVARTEPPHPSDGRGVLVRLTASGKSLVDRIAPIYLVAERETIASLTRPEQAQLATLPRRPLVALD